MSDSGPQNINDTDSKAIRKDKAGGDVDENDEEPQAKLDKASAQNAADMEKVTDYSEEKEFSARGNASAVLSNVASEQAKTAKGPVVITLKKVDIDALVDNFDLKRMYAERLLKKHGGDMRKAVHELLHGWKTTATSVQNPSSNESHSSQPTR
ncbi:hypothetical protein RvY_12565 [Ramazzottius varieornatus]|uniref:Nascent polypeptide-associated complex subunit alpha-like UBA domain-containing protein n=1 Tax=Ramazzottius varieornatus TaxID=947166 RepID=A0A1D1VP46_RAMVA|nr:hypothetical protein RvY_12565 [Ramazzottius varieornatus]